ncbi:hypothetical protein [Pedobacter sp. SL55]|uniref:hypothetical protein n=1 Tax=Pedobacter sp. SL55 TaxID=2995161 RepID=UPI00226F7BF3|nr:hypothetical protein [Pedobacter sp. SL55]WAC40581.1 hypothetical protein OVA16_18750 [Pedobacter sp. SL55]
MENLKELFKTHPSVGAFHKTSDGQFFIEKHHADAHSKTLEDKEVETYERKDHAEDSADTRTREELLTAFETLYGKKAANNIGNEKLLKAVQEKEAETPTQE